MLHPRLVDGRYAFYTRPQDSFIEAGSGGGIGWGLCDDITRATIADEQVIEPRRYHTITESKNGQGPPPILTESGWLHLAHGVRNTAAGLRYVLYVFVTDRDAPWRVTHHYPSDKVQLQDRPIDDGLLVFERLRRDTPPAVDPAQSLLAA